MKDAGEKIYNDGGKYVASAIKLASEGERGTTQFDSSENLNYGFAISSINELGGTESSSGLSKRDGCSPPSANSPGELLNALQEFFGAKSLAEALIGLAKRVLLKKIPKVKNLRTLEGATPSIGDGKVTGKMEVSANDIDSLSVEDSINLLESLPVYSADAKVSKFAVKKNVGGAHLLKNSSPSELLSLSIGDSQTLSENDMANIEDILSSVDENSSFQEDKNIVEVGLTALESRGKVSKQEMSPLGSKI